MIFLHKLSMTFDGLLIGVLQVSWCHNFGVSSSSHGSSNFGGSSGIGQWNVLHALIQQYAYSPCWLQYPRSWSTTRRPAGVVMSHFDGSKPSHGLAVVATAAVAAGSPSNGMCCMSSLNKYIYTPLLAPVIKVRVPTHKCSSPFRF